MESRHSLPFSHVFSRLTALMPLNVALQLYTIRDAIGHDFLNGLSRVSDIGFRNVEFAGFGDATVAQAGNKLDELGMHAVGAHVPLSVLDDPGPVIDDLAEIKCTHATLPWVPEPMRADWVETARRLDATAEMLLDNGIEFAYHNHAFEFENGGYETLTSAARTTKFQLDVFWVEKAGENAIDWIGRLGKRLSSLHCKDLGSDGEDIEIGDGILDWPAIIRTSREAGVTTLIIEMDTPRMEPLQCAKACLEGLNRFL